MPKPDLPSLDLLLGFEAAARHLSFTRAAEELHVTQSAVSRQVKALEESLGVSLFQRQHRALELTEAGQALHRATDEAMRRVETAVHGIRSSGRRLLTVSTTVGFASLWLLPRLTEFRRLHPEIDVRIAADNNVRDLERDDIDVAIRYTRPESMADAGTRLFGEEVFPVCSPALASTLTGAADLREHVLLHLDDPCARWPWLNWKEWLAAMGVPDLPPLGALRFNHYDQVIQAAMAGQGVALGRYPLVGRLLEQGLLMAPFVGRTASSRAYFVVTAQRAGSRPEVQRFVEWLLAEAEKG